jgi:hypothetical protein
MERVGREKLDAFDPHDFLILSLLAEGRKIPAELSARVPPLIEQGILERIGRGKVILSRELYDQTGHAAAQTRKRDQARERNKALLLEFIEKHEVVGSPIKDLLAVLPGLSRDQVRTLLRELRADSKAHPVGATRTALWYPGPEVKARRRSAK